MDDAVSESHQLNRPSARLRRRCGTWGVVALLGVQCAMLAWEADRNSITWDEVAWLPAGISHWTTGSFDLAKVNPPLNRLVAAAPIVILGRLPPGWENLRGHELARMDHQRGREFVEAWGPDAFANYTIARLACIPLILFGGYVCYLWAKRLYGPIAGLVALSIWCFSPTMLAHGQLVTPDATAAALGIAANYAFWRWLVSLERPQPETHSARTNWKPIVVAGVGFGCAELAKTTWIILFGLWPLLWLFWSLTKASRSTPRQLFREFGQLVCILVLGVYVLNMGYGFEGTGKQLGDYKFVSHALIGPTGRPGAYGNRFAESWLGSVPVPLPRNYVQGLDMQKSYFDRDMPSYLRGEWKVGGWRYYYLYALAIKTPLGLWSLTAATLATLAWSPRLRANWRSITVLLAPAGMMLWLVSTQTALNTHSRYVLPILPYLFVFSSGGAAALGGSCGDLAGCLRKRRAVAFASVAGLSWFVASSLWIFPHETTYFNELVGGPWNGPRHLLSSNIDWGQDLLHLRRWLDKHPEARPLGLSYVVPLIDPEIAGIEYESIPPGMDAVGEDLWGLPPAELGPQPGWFAISATHIYESRKQYLYFERFQPVASAGYSTYIYYLGADEVNRVRREYGLPPVSTDGTAE